MDDACAEEEIINSKFKIILLGDIGVGKSAICTQLCKSFFIQSYRETYGCEFYSKNYHLSGRNFVNLQVWDIGFLSLSTQMVDNYIYGANYILFVYDITKRDSYNKIPDLIHLVNEYLGNRKVPFGLIGNKTDLFHLHAVKMSEHAQLTETNKMKSFFMSAKTGDQITDCFISIAAELTGVESNIKINTVGGAQQLANNQSRNDNIEENDDDDDEDEIEEKKKKNLVSSKQPQVQSTNDKKTTKEIPINKKNEKKDGFSMSKSELKKPAVNNSKKSKNCVIF